MHDPAAILAITDPDIFTFQKEPLSVILNGEKVGNSFVSENLDRKPVNLAVNVDSEAAQRQFISIFSKADSAYKKRLNSQGNKKS